MRTYHLLWLRLLLVGLVCGWLGVLGCGNPVITPGLGGVLVLTPTELDPALQRLMPKLKAYLQQLSGHEPTVVPLPDGNEQQVLRAAEQTYSGLVLVIDAHRLAKDKIAGLDALPKKGDPYYLFAENKGEWANNLSSVGSTLVYTYGETKLAKQYAIYECLRRLGARFYHPEQEFVPNNPLGVLRERALTPTIVAHKRSDGSFSPLYRGDYSQRSYAFHGSHPLEHMESFSDGNHPIKEAENLNDWIVKNRGNLFRGAGRGVASKAAYDKRVKELESLRKVMGFPKTAGITLHNEQQGASAAVDRSSSVPPKQQIEEYVTKQLANHPDAVEFGIHFGPTEFTVTPDKETVNWLNWAGQKALSLRPDIRVVISTHISGTQPTQHFDDMGCPPGTNPDGKSDYYDLSFHTDKKLAVKMHTVMFYPLEGPAFVYNQKTFAHKLCLMKKASEQGRELVYFPEGSWWLSFDNSIPVYLPLYMLTRKRDVELLKPLLQTHGKGGLFGHRMFTSGHEWGYWQQDYAVGLWHWNVDISLKAVLGDLFDPLCEAKDWKKGCAAKTEAINVMIELMNHQKKALLLQKDWKGLEGGLFPYLAGEDPADEIAAISGFEFRPVKVAFRLFLKWDSKQLKVFKESDLKALQEMDRLHKGWLDRLQAIKKDVPQAGVAWLDEVMDGIENNMLRARHTAALYSAVIAFREAQLRNEEARKKDPDAKLDDPKQAAAAHWKVAEESLKQAEVVIRRREKQYRYPGEQVYGGGDTPDTQVPNGTTYPWRVHYKTHVLSYWTNRHQQVKDLLDGAGGSNNSLVLSPTIAAPGEPLTITWPPLKGLQASVTIGGTSVQTSDKRFDVGDKEGYWKVEGKLVLDGRDIQLAGGVVRAKIRAVSPPKSFSLTEPDSPLAKSVLNSLFPSILWAYVPGVKGGLAFAPDLDNDGAADFSDVVFASIPDGKTTFSTLPVSFPMPVPDPATGQNALVVRATDVVFSGEAKEGKLLTPIKMAGNLVIDDLVEALIKLAGFDRKGALQTLAGVLKFDVANPPQKRAFKGDMKLSE